MAQARSTRIPTSSSGSMARSRDGGVDAVTNGSTVPITRQGSETAPTSSRRAQVGVIDGVSSATRTAWLSASDRMRAGESGPRDRQQVVVRKACQNASPSRRMLNVPLRLRNRRRLSRATTAPNPRSFGTSGRVVAAGTRRSSSAVIAHDRSAGLSRRSRRSGRRTRTPREERRSLFPAS